MSNFLQLSTVRDVCSMLAIFWIICQIPSSCWWSSNAQLLVNQFCTCCLFLRRPIFSFFSFPTHIFLVIDCQWGFSENRDENWKILVIFRDFFEELTELRLQQETIQVSSQTWRRVVFFPILSNFAEALCGRAFWGKSHQSHSNVTVIRLMWSSFGKYSN